MIKDTSSLLYKEHKEKLQKRKRRKKSSIFFYIGVSAIFLILMVYFWVEGHLDPQFPSILLIPAFVSFWNFFSILEYIQMKRIRPLRIYDWGIFTPEPNILSLKQIKFSNVHRVVINRHYRFTAIFMCIYGKNGGLIEIIGGLDEDDVDHIQQILEEKGISVENKI